MTCSFRYSVKAATQPSFLSLFRGCEPQWLEINESSWFSLSTWVQHAHVSFLVTEQGNCRVTCYSRYVVLRSPPKSHYHPVGNARAAWSLRTLQSWILMPPFLFCKPTLATGLAPSDRHSLLWTSASGFRSVGVARTSHCSANDITPWPPPWLPSVDGKKEVNARLTHSTMDGSQCVLGILLWRFLALCTASAAVADFLSSPLQFNLELSSKPTGLLMCSRSTLFLLRTTSKFESYTSMSNGQQ